jgi:hypothetical protein
VITDYWGAATSTTVPGTVVSMLPTAEQMAQLSANGGLISQIMVGDSLSSTNITSE